MRFRHPSALILLSMSILFGACTTLKEAQTESMKLFADAVKRRELPFAVPPGSKVDSIAVDDVAQVVTITMSPEFSHEAYRPVSVQKIEDDLTSVFGEPFEGYSFRVFTLGQPLSQLVPNYYREDSSTYDNTRRPRGQKPRPEPVVRNVSSPVNPVRGLFGRNVGLWHSHGWYYNSKEDRWEWQRPRLFESVEDLGPMTITLPYLVPMLEHAGARVFLPRERDTQSNEVVVDNDSPGTSYTENVGNPAKGWTTGIDRGFAYGTPPYTGLHNPFLGGTYRVAQSDFATSASCTWTPGIPEEGDYAVYVAYRSSADNVTDARYTVHHAGGRTEFKVNQQIGGSTWMYLGTFTFHKGIHPDSGKVTLTNESSQPGRVVSSDAVRFGGGLGLIARNGTTSGRPKYLEGARYYLQYSGMPDSLVYNLNKDTSDYRDDYQSRAEYLNYLQGAPYGPNKDRTVPGLGIPIDISLAFHTDAGITTSDTVVGTLSIYTIEAMDSARVFPDSMSRMANRDFADLVQSQITDDVRRLHDPAWNRRQLRNADYSESRRPNVPSVLLELLSHQNFLDMQFMLEPRFRFDVARAMYKAILRFLATQYGVPAVVQPLPVTHLAATLDESGRATVQWRPASDPLEPSAIPTGYVLYTRVNDGGFDNGRAVEGNSISIPSLQPGAIYSFKVTAVNDGGESFPSEIISVCRMKNDRPPVLIVNGFTRICGPAGVQAPGFAGFMSDIDAGVPDRVMLNFTGQQYEFLPTSPFRTNDSPGFGASFADQEGTVVAGNTFDFTAVHGTALRDAGYSFCASSKAAVMDGEVRLADYTMVDLILGEEKETHWRRSVIDSLRGPQFKAFPPLLQKAITDYCDGGGNLLLSGAYIGADLFARRDSVDMKFATSVLRYTWASSHASRRGLVVPTRSRFLGDSTTIAFNTQLSPLIYQVESPDAINPAGGSKTILRYKENLFGAGTAYEGKYRVVAFGFPIETITTPGDRLKIMRSVLGFFRL